MNLRGLPFQISKLNMINREKVKYQSLDTAQCFKNPVLEIIN